MNSYTLDVGIIARVCGLPNSPSSLKFELRPSWNNIHDMFPTGTAQDTTAISILTFYLLYNKIIHIPFQSKSGKYKN